MSSPLTPELFNRLESIFGSVKIANEGEELQPEVATNYDAAFSVSGVGSSVRQRDGIRSAGEYYRVCCPLCNDTRHRCWINHRFQDYKYAVICFNERCYENHANRQHLYDMLFRPVGNRRLHVNRGSRPTGMELHSFRHPGQIVLLRQLEFNHPARSYLLTRMFDPDYLSDRYAVSYCYDPDPAFPLLRGRLVFPVMFRGVTVGWQGRFVGEADWSAIPKYFAMPGQWKRFILYNFDRAVKMPWAVMQEGATDVWRVEDHAMAVLGGNMSSFHKDLIGANFQGKPIGVMFDGDDPLAAEKAQDAMDMLEICHAGPRFLVPVPPGMDPAKMSKEVNFQVIHDSARQAGLHL